MNAGTQAEAAPGKYLAFAVSTERYGVDILSVQEIIGVTHITPVPRSPEFIKGVINLRGKIIPVFDLRLKFGIEAIPYNEKTCVIVANVMRGEQRLAVGVIVDTVLEVVHFQANDIAPAPNYGIAVDSRFIVGMGKRDDELTILVDLQKVISDSETDNLAAISSAQASAN